MTPIRRLLIAGCMLAAGTALANPIVDVPSTSVPTPQPLGTTVKLTASASDSDAGTLSYRFDIGTVGSSTLMMVRDFSVDNTFVYTPTDQGGNYRFVVSARNNSTGHIGVNQFSPFKFTALITGGAPAIVPLTNPLTALFSSPPCASGGLNMRVSILRSGSTSPSYTNWKPCKTGQNTNFIIAGMRATSSYSIRSQTWNGSTTSSGPALPFTTGTPPVSFPVVTTPVPRTSQDSLSERFSLMSLIAPALPMAVDISGAAVWYYSDASGVTPTLTRSLTGGNILLLANGANSQGTSTTAQVLREIDIAGNTIRETNSTRIAEELEALSGLTSSCVIGGTDCLVGAFHHEAIRLPNGHTLLLADEEKIFTDGTQGSSVTNPVDIIGDIILDLDATWKLAWYWRAFDHLDATRAAVLGETCVNAQGGCPPIFLTTGKANDWLHGNALFYTPSDGSVLFSMRHQDWVAKIDYGNGTGTKNVLWRLGKGGDFSITSSDPYPWFSHQHDPNFELGGTTVLELFDNGNTRVAPPPIGLGSGNSRGYVLNVDQVNKVVTPVLLANLGFFSQALGTAELLTNGDHHFEAGFEAPVQPTYSEAIEVHPDASLGFTQEIAGVPCYRNFSMVSLYTPP